jgi:hypothetical protein
MLFRGFLKESKYKLPFIRLKSDLLNDQFTNKKEYLF